MKDMYDTIYVENFWNDELLDLFIKESQHLGFYMYSLQKDVNIDCDNCSKGYGCINHSKLSKEYLVLKVMELKDKCIHLEIDYKYCLRLGHNDSRINYSAP